MIFFSGRKRREIRRQLELEKVRAAYEAFHVLYVSQYGYSYSSSVNAKEEVAREMSKLLPHLNESEAILLLQQPDADKAVAVYSNLIRPWRKL